MAEEAKAVDAAAPLTNPRGVEGFIAGDSLASIPHAPAPGGSGSGGAIMQLSAEVALIHAAHLTHATRVTHVAYVTQSRSSARRWPRCTHS